MPNTLAYLALMAWPLVIALMFRKMAPERALIWAILGGYLLLPEAARINFPMIPPFDKVSIPNLTTFALCVAIFGTRIVAWPSGWSGRILFVALITAPIFTVFANTEPVLVGAIESGRLLITGEAPPVRGMRLYDSASVLVQQIIALLPFILGYHLLRSAEGLEMLLRALVIAGLIYSLPMLWEIRFSPQLHTIVYGFFQHDFGQMIRWGGYRPIVFLPHGLWLSLFAAMTVMAALHVLRHSATAQRPRALLIALYLCCVLILSKSLGPILIVAVLAPLILYAGPKLQLSAAAMIGLIALVFPLLRGAGLIPTDMLVRELSAHSAERAHSLGFRFDNEDLLLARAADKPLVGWGAWGRNLIHDPITGEAATISDGFWVITIGQFGWIGYLATFGLLALPLFALWRHGARRSGAQIAPQVGSLALIFSGNLFDLLPNATLVPWTWLMAGALLGQAAQLARQTQDPVAPATRDSLLSRARVARQGTGQAAPLGTVSRKERGA